MSKRRSQKWRLLPLLAALIGGCDLPGRPIRAEAKSMDFSALYATRCAGSPGADGRFGAEQPLTGTTFHTIVPDAELIRVIREGRTVTAGQKSPMPAFAHDRGGPLSDIQIKVLAGGIKKRWPPPALPSSTLPPYVAPTVTRGENKDERSRLFARACAGYHGPQGKGDKDGRPLVGGAINDRSFLALISDQALRRIIITGRPDLGMPAYNGKASRPSDFRGLSSAEINDLVALLGSWRQGERNNK